MPLVLCRSCRKAFYAKPSWIKNGYGKYCSRKCSHESQKNGRTFSCFTCGKTIYRSVQHQGRSKSGKYFCGKSCQTMWRNSIVHVGENHANWKNGINVYRNILKRGGGKLACAKCQTNDTRILAVHHKDKDRQNNSLPNLLWLCHNCHFLVHHYNDESQGFLTPKD